MSNEFLDYVEDIADAMEKAEILLKGVTYDQFESDFRINFSVVRALEIVGEATKRLPMTLRAGHPSIPWKQIAGVGTESFMVTTPSIWRSSGMFVRQDIPKIKPRIEQILKDYAS